MLPVVRVRDGGHKSPATGSMLMSHRNERLMRLPLRDSQHLIRDMCLFHHHLLVMGQVRGFEGRDELTVHV